MAAVTDRVEIAGVAVSPDHYIGGRRVASRHRFDVRSAVDGRTSPTSPRARPTRSTRPSPRPSGRSPAWRDLGPEGRHEPLMRLAEAITRRVPDIAVVESTTQRLVDEAMRERVIRRGAHNIDHFAEAALHVGAGEAYEHSSGTATSRVRYEPSGVAALITPWNAPFMLSPGRSARRSRRAARSCSSRPSGRR